MVYLSSCHKLIILHIINDKNIDIHNQGEISRIINTNGGMYDTI